MKPQVGSTENEKKSMVDGFLPVHIDTSLFYIIFNSFFSVTCVRYLLFSLILTFHCVVSDMKHRNVFFSCKKQVLDIKARDVQFFGLEYSVIEMKQNT